MTTLPVKEDLYALQEWARGIITTRDTCDWYIPLQNGYGGTIHEWTWLIRDGDDEHFIYTVRVTITTYLSHLTVGDSEVWYYDQEDCSVMVDAIRIDNYAFYRPRQSAQLAFVVPVGNMKKPRNFDMMLNALP